MKKGGEYELKSLHFEVLCSQFFRFLALFAYRANQISGGKNERQNEKKTWRKKNRSVQSSWFLNCCCCCCCCHFFVWIFSHNCMLFMSLRPFCAESWFFIFLSSRARCFIWFPSNAHTPKKTTRDAEERRNRAYTFRPIADNLINCAFAAQHHLLAHHMNKGLRCFASICVFFLLLSGT